MGCRHKFQPRYDKEWSTALQDCIASNRIKNANFKNMEEPYLRKETYVFDICIKCGIVITRKDAQPK